MCACVCACVNLCVSERERRLREKRGREEFEEIEGGNEVTSGRHRRVPREHIVSLHP